MAKDALPKATRFEEAAAANGTWDGTDEADAAGLPVPTGMVAMVVGFPAAADVAAGGPAVAGAVGAVLAPAGAGAGAVPTTRAGAGVVAAGPEGAAAGVEKAT